MDAFEHNCRFGQFGHRKFTTQLAFTAWHPCGSIEVPAQTEMANPLGNLSSANMQPDRDSK